LFSKIQAIRLTSAVERVAPACRVAVGPQPAEADRIESLPDFVEQDCRAIAQQPPVAGAKDLSGEHQPHRGHHVGADLTGRTRRHAGNLSHRRVGPHRAGGFGAAGQPAFLPAVSGLLL
jgi:hypothetical protein